MAQHIVNAPDGQQHIINAPDNATPDEVLAYAQKSIPMSQNKSFTQRVGADYDKRVQNAQEAVNAGVEGSQSMPETIGQSAYQLVAAPIADTAGEAMKSFYDVTAAPSVKAGFKQIGGMISDSPVGDAARWAGKQLPDEGTRARRNLDAVAGTASSALMFAPGAAAAKGVGEAFDTGLETAGNALVKSGMAAKDAQRMSFAQKLVAPLNDTKAARIDAVGNTDVQGILQKSVVQPTSQEIESARNVAEIPGVKSGNTFQANRNAISDAIGTEAEALKGKLDQSGISYLKVKDPTASPIPQNAFHDTLNQAVASIPSEATLTGDANAVAQRLANKMHEFVAANPPTPSGLLEARKQFDRFLDSQKKNVFDPATQSALQVAKDTVRQTANNFIAETVPDASVKASLAKQSSLFRALDNIDPKAAGEAPTALGRMGQRMDAAMPVKNALVKGAGAVTGAGLLGTATALAPSVVIPAAATAGALYGAGKAVMAPTTRILAGKALLSAKEIGALKPADALKYLNSLKRKK